MLIVAVAIASVSCQNMPTATDAARKVKYQKAIAADNNMERANFPGKIMAATDVNLGFRVAGIIDEISVADGAYVGKGAVVARLDSRDYELQLAATQAEYDAIKAEVDRVVALYAEQSVSANDYDKATNGLRAITAKLEAHKNALADTYLRSPVDGYLYKSNFDKGEAVAAGTPVVSIISSAKPQIEINIPAAYYLKQSRYKSASASIELFADNRFDLTLKSISPKANINQLYKATFVVEPLEGVSTPAAGMSAMVEISYSNDDAQRIIIPFSAVVERSGESLVWVVEEGQVASRKVEIEQILSSGQVYIKSGLAADEVVVVAGVNSLKEGQKVEPLAEATRSNVGGIK